MDTINITEVRPDWYIATTVMLTGKIFIGIGTTKVEAIEKLKEEFNK